jgi:23S rRNA (guanine745-N1)-methyltransferase
MRVAPLIALVCPIDGTPLTRVDAQQRCASGHSFDVAREGYCNLLVVQHKASLDPGDSKEMVAARRRVLEAGHYAPIAAHVFEAHLQPLARAQDRALRVVDAGCGEGDYLDRIAALASDGVSAGQLELAGADVSKWAVKAAARRKAPVTWLVANNARLPFAPGSVDLILCLFGFPIWDRFATLQQTGQHVLLVDPGRDHLLELREIIYPTVQKSGPPALTAAENAGYRLVKETCVRFSTTLMSAQMIADLTAMTPHAHRMSAAGRDALAQLQALTVSVDVVARLVLRT